MQKLFKACSKLNCTLFVQNMFKNNHYFLDYDNLELPLHFISSDSILKHENWIQKFTQLSVEQNSSSILILSQLNIKLLPFVSAASRLDLLQIKFRVAELPPLEEFDIRILVAVIPYLPNVECVLAALNLFKPVY